MIRLNVYLKYSMKELLKKPKAFLSGFLVCFGGMLITFNMLFMQYGAHTANIRAAEEKYHICLPELTAEDITKIGEMPYVKSVRAEKDGDSLTAYIRLFDNDPYSLKQQCNSIIVDTGIGEKPEYKSNIYYNRYGPQENWINNEYYELATDNFFLSLLPMMIPLIVMTVVCIYISLRIKIKNDISDYAAMRSYGYSTKMLVALLRVQYTVIYLAAAILALIFGCVGIKLLSVLIAVSGYTENFQQMDFVVPAIETASIFIAAYVLLMLCVCFCKRSLGGNICSMLEGAVSSDASAVSVSSKSLDISSSLSDYVRLYMRRMFKKVFMQVLRKSVLLMLPFIFVFMAASIYGMRSQADIGDRDMGIHSWGQNLVTDAVIAEVEAIEFVEKAVYYGSYENGTYGGIEIYCTEGTLEEAAVHLSALANKYALLFTDDFRNDILVVQQSNTFTVFYMLQSLILFATTLLVSVADTRYILLCRTYELSVMRALGVCRRELRKLYYPEMITVFAAFVTGAAVIGVVGMLGLGMPYIRPLFIAIVAVCFAMLYVGSHYLVCRRHMKHIAEGSIVTNIKAIDI